MGSIQAQLSTAQKAKKSIQRLLLADKQAILIGLSERLLENMDHIIQENQRDLQRMSPTDSKYDRLLLNKERIISLSNSVLDVANLPDPTGKILSSKRLPNGLTIEKKSVALGVVAVIYEARPNVTIDVAALCIQSGNVCLLRGGSDAVFTNTYLVQLIQESLTAQGVDEHIVQLLPTDRALLHELLTATQYVDIIIPRGSQSLIDFVRANAKVPVIETGAGVCHTYVDKFADLEKAVAIVVNAKTSRPSVCNSLDTILVDSEVAEPFIQKLASHFIPFQVEVFASEEVYPHFAAQNYPYLTQAQDGDFGREFLDFKCSIKAVEGLSEALEHIEKYSSKHSECIVSKNEQHIEIFLQMVDAAAVYANASTRFTDGGEFGLGAEIGISTQKLHARGPFALEKLVTEKWYIRGDGQIR
ncbi:glutamate-5-semialdehyde dehydrogenase [Sphingobacterium alimentarium]|uniref:Gamma-glutamyl phosphate reductase n=1 Tax=Sphingobacterium alimentarium TaxID=797292 RepID=A0A4R3VYU6_9SPHI|nr:glutamate-5-semialdehyde dehydrogenase [Sphingobacterium alimentarium]TCV19494.1 glutamate-5-semialdehyde dehydrogenase [Sphingobacterium alimentarium]